ncbi:MAG: hypothetical protein ACYTFV_02790 [Planctomycetota bacterium]|jgi:hypothetical protein
MALNGSGSTLLIALLAASFGFGGGIVAALVALSDTPSDLPSEQPVELRLAQAVEALVVELQREVEGAPGGTRDEGAAIQATSTTPGQPSVAGPGERVRRPEDRLRILEATGLRGRQELSEGEYWRAIHDQHLLLPAEDLIRKYGTPDYLAHAGDAEPEYGLGAGETLWHYELTDPFVREVRFRVQGARVVGVYKFDR